MTPESDTENVLGWRIGATKTSTWPSFKALYHMIYSQRGAARRIGTSVVHSQQHDSSNEKSRQQQFAMAIRVLACSMLRGAPRQKH